MSDQYQMQSKKFLRKFFVDRRNDYFEEYDKKNNAHTHLKIILENTKPCVVGSYLPFRNEFSTQLLNDELNKLNFNLSLPCINKNDSSMIFRNYTSDSSLVPNSYGILEPSQNAEEVVPSIIIAPLVAFSLAGYRLGYGGGYYDRYIEKNLDNKSLIKIGLGFSFQKYDKLPNENHDQKLDWILTENYLYKVK
ncbi:5-formyltetrahydrofolate cyclo-ligase [Pelagibacteraceae bacterium]|nr:5-formyltetrahydrofolate cyclo-ligase [Pelagibacteraceae bacterium]